MKNNNKINFLILITLLKKIQIKWIIILFKKNKDIKNDVNNISLKKNSGSWSSKFSKIKSLLNKLIIEQNEGKNKNNRNKQLLEKRTIRRREKVK